jgi:Bacterial Ig domain
LIQKYLTLLLFALISGNVINFSLQNFNFNHLLAAEDNSQPSDDDSQPVEEERNEAPKADNQKVSVDANDDVKISLEGNDDDKGDKIKFDIVSDPSHGKLDNFDKSDGTVTYVPGKDYSGDDDFKFKVIDDKGADSDKATVAINVKATNQAPEADDQKVSVDANDNVKISLEGNDDDKGDSIEFDVVSDPSHGKLDNFDKSVGTVTYTPDKDYSGDDDFTFKLSDDKGAESDTAEVKINVKAIVQSNQQAEAATNQQAEAATNQQAEAATNETNQQAEAATNGTNQEVANQTARADEQSKSVDTENQSPTAYDQSLSVDANDKVVITLVGNDADNDTIQYAIVSNPSDASLDNFDMAKGTVTYIPEPDYVGNDSFAFKVIDDKAVESNIATVNVDVKEINQTNQAPQAFNQSANESNLSDYRYLTWSAGEDEDRYILFARSTDGGKTYSSPVSLSGNIHSDVFNPAVSSSGNDVYVVWQGLSKNGNQDIFLRKSTDYGSSFGKAENISNDPGGSGNPEVEIVGNITHVAWEGTTPGNNFIFYTKSDDGSGYDSPQKLSSNKGISYKPEIIVKDSPSSDSFTYMVTDEKGAQSNVATVDVNVDTIDKPKSEDDAKDVSVDTNQEIDITLRANDKDNDTLQFEIVTPPSEGTLDNFEPNSGTVTYIPNKDDEVDISWHNYINGNDRTMTKIVDDGGSDSGSSAGIKNNDPFKAKQ